MVNEDKSNQGTDEVAVLIEQYKTAVGLYTHEDELNWKKTNNLFYLNFGLWAVVGLVLKTENFNTALIGSPQFFMKVISFNGVIMSLVLGIAVWSGIGYMQSRKYRAFDIEEELIKKGGKPVLLPASKSESFLRESRTIWMLRLLPIIFIVIWLVVFIINI